MAAADVDTIPQETNKLFFCHECTREVYPKLPDYTCSRCNSGFIEELSNTGDDEDEVTVTDEWQRRPIEPRGFTTDRRRVTSQLRTRTGPHIMFQIGGSGPSSFQMSSSGAGGNASIDSFIQQVFNNLGVQVMRPGGVGAAGGGPGGNFNLGTAFGDYVWGPNGLDNIITQLLNQLENTGPPPAEKSKIESIPVVMVSEKDVLENTECAVCQCKYDIGEEVKQIPCTHMFHTECLDPWLVLHDSCPICRCNLNGERPAMES